MPVAQKDSSNKLTDIAGVGKARAKKLEEAGFASPSELASASVDDLHDAGISGATAKKLIENARKLAGMQKTPKSSVRVTEDSEPLVPQRPSRWKRVGVAALVVVIVALGVLAATGTPLGFGGDSSQPAAAVNGEVITASQLDAQYDSLPAQLQQQYSREDVLRQLVDKQLILQYAEEQGISVSDADVEARIDEQVQELGISRDELSQVLANGNVSLAQYRTAVREELILQQVLEGLQQDVSVSDEQVRSAYEQLPAQNNASFESLEPQLRQSLEQRAAQQAFSDLLDSLRSEADIDYYGEYQSLQE